MSNLSGDGVQERFNSLLLSATLEPLFLLEVDMKTYCKRGHELTEDNIYIRKSGYKECYVCKSISARKNAKLRPWMRGYYGAKYRCRKNDFYTCKGIKLLMSASDFKFLWFRDKAYNMKRPSIDRINNDGNYELSNCRYLELRENRRKGRAKPVSQFTLDGFFVKTYETLLGAAKAMGTDQASIRRAAKGDRGIKQSCGYKWELIT